MKLIYENKFLRIFILENGTYRIEVRDFVNPEEYILYAKGDTIPQALVRLEGRREALLAKLHELDIGIKKAFEWDEKHG